MTFSILARDPETGAIGGAAATGSACVGGWALRGTLESGMSASQGVAPSTYWGNDVLAEMREGQNAGQAVQIITGRDTGKTWRQLSALDIYGGTGAFTGTDNPASRGARRFRNGVACGTMLSEESVLDALVDAFIEGRGCLGERLLAGLDGARQAGGEHRALCSAALLVLRPDHAPLDLRVDCADRPLEDLRTLIDHVSGGSHADLLRLMPCQQDPQRSPASVE